MLERDILAASIEQHIREAVDQSVEVYVSKIIDELMLDDKWVGKIQTLINQSFINKFAETLSLLDVQTLIKENIDAGFERWQDKLKQNFETTGILDNAGSKQLTIMDDAVVATHGLASQTLLIEKDAEVQGSLRVKDLAVIGSINTDNRAWDELSQVVTNDVLSRLTGEWRRHLVAEVVEMSSDAGIDFKDITINGSPLVADGTLSKGIVNSSLETVGVLKGLKVSGDLDAQGTLAVRSRRVGINTIDPEMAFNVWDGEVSILAGKLSEDRGYVGTGRRQTLALGVDRKTHLEIDPDGVTTIKELRVDRFKIGHTNQTPGHSGQRGDFLINSDLKPGEPFAWVCLGNYSWQPLKIVPDEN